MRSMCAVAHGAPPVVARVFLPLQHTSCGTWPPHSRAAREASPSSSDVQDQGYQRRLWLMDLVTTCANPATSNDDEQIQRVVVAVARRWAQRSSTTGSLVFIFFNLLMEMGKCPPL